MKKLTLFICIIVAAGFVSCKKCTTCQVVAGAGYSTYPEEKCGTNSELEDFEKLYKQRALESIVPGSRVECNTK